jgi:hypothetical protein
MLEEAAEAEDLELIEVEPISYHIFSITNYSIISSTCNIHQLSIIISRLFKMLFKSVIFQNYGLFGCVASEWVN